MHKIFKHRKLPRIPCLGKRILSCNDTTFVLHFYKAIFSTPVASSNLRNQALLFTEFWLLQGTKQNFSKMRYISSEWWRCQAKFLTSHHVRIHRVIFKYADKTHDYGLGIRV